MNSQKRSLFGQKKGGRKEGLMRRTMVVSKVTHFQPHYCSVCMRPGAGRRAHHWLPLMINILLDCEGDAPCITSALYCHPASSRSLSSLLSHRPLTHSDNFCRPIKKEWGRLQIFSLPHNSQHSDVSSSVSSLIIHERSAVWFCVFFAHKLFSGCLCCVGN